MIQAGLSPLGLAGKSIYHGILRVNITGLGQVYSVKQWHNKQLDIFNILRKRASDYVVTYIQIKYFVFGGDFSFIFRQKEDIKLAGGKRQYFKIERGNEVQKKWA